MRHRFRPSWPFRILGLAVMAAAVATPSGAGTGTGPGGYTWKDCLEVDGPPCGYTLTATDDEATGLCTEEVLDDPFEGIGFTFPFYGINYTDYAVSANGVVYLSNAPACCDDANAALTGLEGRAFLAVLWDDWAMDNWDESFGICGFNPECSNTGWETFVVESLQRGTGVEAGVPYKEFGWYSTAHHRPFCTEDIGEQATFGLRLYADGRILFLYDDTFLGRAELDHGASATIGISSGFGGEFTQVSFDTASVPANPHAILFTPPCRALTCTRLRVAPAGNACDGDAQTFTLDTAGGEGVVSVAWDLDGDTATDDATGNPITRALPVGTWTVTAAATDECPPPDEPDCTLTTTVVVHPLPQPVITPLGSLSFCAADGETVRLDGGAWDGYRWERNGAAIPGATAPTYTATQSGDYTVTVTDGNGCTGTSPPVTVNAADCVAGCGPLSCLGVTISPNPACEGTQQTFTASFAGGEGAITVGWDLDGDTAVDVTGNPLRTVLAAGSRAITAHVTDSCPPPPGQTCTASSVANVVASPSPVVTAAGPTNFCATSGETVRLDATPGLGTHAWELDGSVIPGETAPSIVVSASGSYTVVVTAAPCPPVESAPVTVNAADCASPCAALACAAVIATPLAGCEGVDQDLLLDFTGGEGVVTVSWDLDGDGADDATGNPVTVRLPVGVTSVRATATDECPPPDTQSCSLFEDVTVDPGAPSLREVSDVLGGAPPLLVSPGGSRLTVESVAGVTSYNAHVGDVGAWYAPTRTQHPSWTDNADGTVSFDVTWPVGSWVVVTAANTCAEGVAGSSSLGVERTSVGTWTLGP